MSLASEAARVELRGVHRSFAETGPVVENLNLQIGGGEFIALLGPSGCGKSTILRLIAGLIEPDQGIIETSTSGTFRGFVFQEAHLLPWRTALANVGLPLELMHKPRGSIESAARSALKKVGLESSDHKYPDQLSGGMKMRVSVARALVSEPRLLLLDEPFAALDENTRHRLQEDLRQLWLREKMTVVFVTHSVSEAVFLADRAIVYSQRPARMVLDHKINLPTERSRVTPEYLREIATLSRALAESDQTV